MPKNRPQKYRIYSILKDFFNISTPQPQKGKGKGLGALKTPKSAPPLRKKKKVEDEEVEEAADIETMLKSFSAKGKMKSPKMELLISKGGSEESEDDEDFTGMEDDVSDEEESDDGSANLEDGDDNDDDDESDDEDVEDDDDDDDDSEGSDDDEEEEGSDLEEKIAAATKEQLKKTKRSKKEKVVPNMTKLKGVKKDANKSSAQNKANLVSSLKPSEDESSQEAVIIQQELAADVKRRAERDCRTLFVKNIKQAVTEEALKRLSPDIEEVRLGRSGKGSKGSHRGFAFLGFKDEATAEQNLKVLHGTVLEGRKIFVDFVGAKSKHKQEHEIMKSLKPDEIDATKLYVTGFDVDMTSEKLNKLFPKAYNVTLPIHGKDKRPLGYGFVHFATAEEASAAHNDVQDKIAAGHRLTVLFAKKAREGQKRQPEPSKPSKGEPAKKKKKKVEETKVEEEDDDSEEDDDEGDLDDDDDDDDESD